MNQPVEISFSFRNQRFSEAAMGLEAFANQLGRSMDRAATVLSREMRVYLDAVAVAMSRRHGKNWPGGTTDKTLSRRSGRLMQSIADSVKVTGQKIDTIEGQIGGPFWLRTHEFGATIRPKKALYLTIPLPAALRTNGTKLRKSARDWPNTFVRMSKKGNLLIFQRRGERIVPLYLLKKEVKIKPRLGLGDTLRIGIPYFVDKASAAIAKEFMAGP